MKNVQKKTEMNVLRIIGISLTALALNSAFAASAYSQDSETSAAEDEIIVRGSTVWESHEGLDAFRNGDFEKAEIEFEKEFKSLKRARSATENAAIAADIGFDRAQDVGQASISGGGSGGPAGGPPPEASAVNAPDLGVNGSFSSRRSEGRTVFNDGKVTEQDFAFSKYMSGLSEVKLGKIDEAKSSFKTSLRYDKSNYDARMRLGLIYVLENDFDKAADQLESLEKLRSKCKAKDCEDYEDILGSAKTLAQNITNKLRNQ